MGTLQNQEMFFLLIFFLRKSWLILFIIDIQKAVYV